MNKQWYVLHVLTGAELEVRRQLEGLGYTASVPQEARQIRRDGQWREELYTLLPGYVFLQARYSPRIHHMLKGVSGAIQLLSKGNPHPLVTREVEWLTSIGYSGILLRPSKVDFSGDRPKVLDGPLKDFEQYIIKIDRRRRRAHVRVPVLGAGKDMALSILPV